MTERKNLITNIVDKTKQFIADIKTRQQEQLAREAEWWEKYLTTPPQNDGPTSKTYTRNVGAMGGFECTVYNWNPEIGKWTQTERYGESGYCSH